MRANDFIKAHGIAEAKRILHDARGCVGVKLWGRYEFSTDDLKRIVESHELVESYGGIRQSRRWIERTVFKLSDSMIALKKAIADVESCQ